MKGKVGWYKTSGESRSSDEGGGGGGGGGKLPKP